jgi:hypothetical protein
VLHAFRALLLGHTADISPFLNDVERLQQRRRQGRVPEADDAAMVNDLRLKVIGFFKQIVTEAHGS